MSTRAEKLRAVSDAWYRHAQAERTDEPEESDAFWADVASILKGEAKHLPGGHDQLTHGRQGASRWLTEGLPETGASGLINDPNWIAGRIAPGPPEKVWVITDDPRFEMDPKRVPSRNYTSLTDLHTDPVPGVYVTNNVEHWWNRYGYRRPFVAEITVDGKVPWENVPQGGSQSFISAEDFDKLHVDRVLPSDEWVRENYHDYGWVEEYNDTPRRAGATAFPEDYRFEGDARDMSEEEIEELRRRFAAYWDSPDNPWREEDEEKSLGFGVLNVKHLPGLHDQDRHGHRGVPKLPDTLELRVGAGTRHIFEEVLNDFNERNPGVLDYVESVSYVEHHRSPGETEWWPPGEKKINVTLGSSNIDMLADRIRLGQAGGQVNTGPGIPAKSDVIRDVLTHELGHVLHLVANTKQNGKMDPSWGQYKEDPFWPMPEERPSHYANENVPEGIAEIYLAVKRYRSRYAELHGEAVVADWERRVNELERLARDD